MIGWQRTFLQVAKILGYHLFPCTNSLGGTMPSHSLLLNFQSDLKISDHWGIDGTHYEKTLNIWLEKMDQNKDIILPIFKATYGDKVRIMN